MRQDTPRTTAYRLLIAIAAVEHSEKVLQETMADLSTLMRAEADTAADPLWDEVDRRLARLGYRSKAPDLVAAG